MSLLKSTEEGSSPEEGAGTYKFVGMSSSTAPYKPPVESYCSPGAALVSFADAEKEIAKAAKIKTGTVFIISYSCFSLLLF